MVHYFRLLKLLNLKSISWKQALKHSRIKICAGNVLLTPFNLFLCSTITSITLKSCMVALIYNSVFGNFFKYLISFNVESKTIFFINLNAEFISLVFILNKNLTIWLKMPEIRTLYKGSFRYSFTPLIRSYSSIKWEIFQNSEGTYWPS